MQDVICPNCSKKLGEIDKENLSIIAEKGVEVTKPHMSIGGLIVVSYKCPECEKLKVEAFTI